MESATIAENRLAVASLCDCFQRTVAEQPDAVALRTPGGEHEISWREYGERVRRLAAGLAALGVARGDTVALMLGNRPEFNLVDTAALHLGAAPFSIYNTFAPEQIAHLLANAGNRVVVCEAQYLQKVRQAAAGTAVDQVICIDGSDPGTIGLDELEHTGDPRFDFEAAWRAVGPDDLATLIYTSGTTGPPKGVEITHRNVLASLRAVGAVVPSQAGDRLISYLPAAHIADRFFSHYVALAFGAQTTCVADARTVAGVLPEVRPTSFAAVPRIWEKLKAAIEARIAAEPDERRRVAVEGAIEVGLRKVRAEQAAMRGEGEGPDDALVSEYAQARKLVLDPLRASIGLDQARWTMSGAAPIAPETLEFFLALGLPVCELWGMSEMFGGTLNPPGRVKLGTVGPALPGIELRVAPDGELLIKGDTVMRGYRAEPEKTAEAIDADGWLHTGDVAEVDEDGYVRIVDRKKELIISAAGKNMSPVNIENTVKAACGLVGQVVAIGDRRPYNVALITLDPEALAGRSPHDPEVTAEVEAGIERANDRLARVEQIKCFRILDAEWEAGGEELTPTMKLKRRPIAEKYAAEIDALYAQ